jgi:hypothetical protein
MGALKGDINALIRAVCLNYSLIENSISDEENSLCSFRE